MVQPIKLKTTDDVVLLSQYANRIDDEMWLMDGHDRECIDARSIIGVFYAMSKFRNIQLCVFRDDFVFPE